MAEYFAFAEAGDRTVSLDMIFTYGRTRRESKGVKLNPYAAVLRELNSKISNA